MGRIEQESEYKTKVAVTYGRLYRVKPLCRTQFRQIHGFFSLSTCNGGPLSISYSLVNWSEPHTSKTALHDACVCLLAAIYRKF